MGYVYYTAKKAVQIRNSSGTVVKGRGNISAGPISYYINLIEAPNTAVGVANSRSGALWQQSIVSRLEAQTSCSGKNL
jgi:hypothetical protein